MKSGAKMVKKSSVSNASLDFENGIAEELQISNFRFRDNDQSAIQSILLSLRGGRVPEVELFKVVAIVAPITGKQTVGKLNECQLD